MFLKVFLATLGRSRSLHQGQETGFALPMAMILGMIMLAMAGTSLMLAQGDRNNASQRKASGASLIVSDGAMSRALLQLSKPQNGVLLIRDYDPIDPRTGKNYFGPDGIPGNGDETTEAVDQWTNYDLSSAPCFQQIGRGAPNITLTGTIGTNETYTIKAYRYDKVKKVGTLLVEGKYKAQSSLLTVSLSIEPIFDDFPGLMVFNEVPTNPIDGRVVLRGRSVQGRNGNIYYAPFSSKDSSLTGSSALGDPTRPNYRNAIWSGPSDGANNDTIEAKIFACNLHVNIPITPQGTNLGDITTSQIISGISGGIAHYQINSINLNNNHILTVDTTAGPVYLYLVNGGKVQLHHTAKIINSRTDGQSPKVGDLRILSNAGDNSILLYDRSCIQNAFLHIRYDNLELLSSGAGCPGGKNTNFEGVAWMEEIFSSKNNASNPDITTMDTARMNTYFPPSTTSGIAVPEDVSSLADLLEYVDWPARYRYGSIKNWQRVN